MFAKISVGGNCSVFPFLVAVLPDTFLLRYFMSTDFYINAAFFIVFKDKFYLVFS